MSPEKADMEEEKGRDHISRTSLSTLCQIQGQVLQNITNPSSRSVRYRLSPSFTREDIEVWEAE